MARFSYTLAANAHGSALVTASIHDSGGTANGGDDASDPQTFVITVTAGRRCAARERGWRVVRL